MARDPDLSCALTVGTDGLYLDIEVTPQARTDRFPDGYDPWRRRIGVRVTAPARDGQANRAVCRIVAERLDLPARAVRLVRGSSASSKTLHLTGIDRDVVLRHLEEAIA